MTCRHVDLGGGVRAIACSRGVKPPVRHYSFTPRAPWPGRLCGSGRGSLHTDVAGEVTCQRCRVILRDAGRFAAKQLAARQQTIGGAP